MDSFLPIFQSKICSRLPSLPSMPQFLPILPLFFDTLVPDKQDKLCNSTFCILFLPFPLSFVKKLFSSLCSQTEPVYKWQKALPSLKNPFLCYSYHAFSYNPYFNQTKWTNYKAIKQITTTFHITYQLLYVSAPRSHLHRVYKKTKDRMSDTCFKSSVALPSSLRIKS